MPGFEADQGSYARVEGALASFDPLDRGIPGSAYDSGQGALGEYACGQAQVLRVMSSDCNAEVWVVQDH
eukprot:10175157-Heterocapsa_arctica.AAC.1